MARGGLLVRPIAPVLRPPPLTFFSPVLATTPLLAEQISPHRAQLQGLHLGTSSSVSVPHRGSTCFHPPCLEQWCCFIQRPARINEALRVGAPALWIPLEPLCGSSWGPGSKPASSWPKRKHAFSRSGYRALYWSYFTSSWPVVADYRS